MTSFIGKTLRKSPAFMKWAYNASYFPQLGMMRHDALRNDDPIITEAVSRLPKDLQAERQFRISRAIYLSCRQQILPREEWMTLEEDELYLLPYIEEVKQEIQEKNDYERTVLSFKIKK